MVSLTCFGTGIEGKSAAHGLFVGVPFHLRKRRAELTPDGMLPHSEVRLESD